MATTKKKKTKAAEHVYVLRCCLASMISTNGFRWPESGQVECPDWSAEAKCGNGLHGWLWGEGNISVATGYDDPASRWLVVKVARADVVNLDGKVKFPRGEVVFCGDRSAAAAEIRRLGATGAVIGTVALSEDAKIALAGGARSTLTGGYGSTLTGGYGSTLTGGDGSTLTGGARSTLTGGDGSTLTGGENGSLQVRWWDGKRYRVAVFYVGEDGIEAGVAYVANDRGEIVRAK